MALGCLDSKVAVGTNDEPTVWRVRDKISSGQLNGWLVGQIIAAAVAKLL